MGFYDGIIDIYTTINQYSNFIPFGRNDYYRQIIVKRQEIIKNAIRFIYFNNLYLLLHKKPQKNLPLKGKVKKKSLFFYRILIVVECCTSAAFGIFTINTPSLNSASILLSSILSM